MKVTEHLAKATHPLISFEITPPKRGGGRHGILGKVEKLAKYRPPFIHVTSRAAERDEDGRSIKRKRPGTLGLCTTIKERYGIDAVCHVLCRGFYKHETEDLLVDLDYGELHNVLAIRGDAKDGRVISDGSSVNDYASNLVKQIRDMNEGVYLGDEKLEPTDFCIGVAGYPEKHSEALSLIADMENLKLKVDSGANYIITQMCYNNETLYRFLDDCQKRGINVPIIPGLKVLTLKDHLISLREVFKIRIPNRLEQRVINAEAGDVEKIGIDWTTEQAQQLISQGFPGIHLFISESAKISCSTSVVDNLNLNSNL